MQKVFKLCETADFVFCVWTVITINVTSNICKLCNNSAQMECFYQLFRIPSWFSRRGNVSQSVSCHRCVYSKIIDIYYVYLQRRRLYHKISAIWIINKILFHDLKELIVGLKTCFGFMLLSKNKACLNQRFEIANFSDD